MRADARANRDQIVEAAKTLFHEQGVDIPLRTIAVRANVGVATLHRHFPDRESLVHAVAELVYINIQTIIAEHMSVWPMDPWGAWTGFVQDLADRGIAMIGDSVLEFATREDRMELFHQFIAGNDGQPLEQVLNKARQYGYVPHDLLLHDFMFGITVVSRPLPNTAQRISPEQRRWLIITYLDGLRSQASRP